MDNNRKEKHHHEKQDADNGKRITTVEEVAQYLGKSVSWVYKNSETLGGRKLGGSLFFPSKEDLYDNFFSERKGVEVRLRTQNEAIYQSLVQNKDRSQTGRGNKKRRVEKPATSSGGADRHGLLGPCKSST